jgi:hypothetical protein
MAKKKIGKKEQARLDQERDERIERQLKEQEAFHTRFNKVIFKARVVFFNKGQGVGLVQGIGENEDVAIEIYACNIRGKKTWYPETACVFYDKGQEIEIEVDTSSKLAIGHTQGTLDVEKWDSLDQSRLAFKCNDQGEAINGLFA